MMTQNWLSELLEDLTILSQNDDIKINIDKFKAMNSEISHQVLGRNELKGALEDLGKVTGWLQTTGAVITLLNEAILADDFILNGEWIINSDKDSVQASFVLEYIGDFKWMLQKCLLDFTGNKSANALAERITHKAVGSKNNQNLVYQKLWTYQDSAAVADSAFFTGFDS